MAMNPLGRKLDKNGNPIVGKKELEASGLSLRDFLNKERKLKRADGSDREPVHVDAEAGMSRGRRDYVTSGKQSFDTETEPSTPDMSAYKPRRAPKPLTEVTKPGTRTNYENEDGMKKGGSVKGWGKARGARKAKIY